MKGGKHVLAIRYCLCLFLVSGLCFAAGRDVDVYKVSVIAASTGVGLDVASSWGHYEATALYRSSDGRFHTKGASIRIGMLVGVLIAQKIVRKRVPENKFVKKVFTVVNLSVCGSATTVAIHNWR